MYFYFSISTFLLLSIAQCYYPGVQAASIATRANVHNNAISISLKSFFNHQAYGDKGDMDGFGTHFVLGNSTQGKNQDVLAVGTVQYTMRQNYGSAESDNVLARGQTITLPSHLTGALYMLVAAAHGPVTTNVVVTYVDNSSSTTTLSLPDWQFANLNQIDRFDVLTQPLSNGNQGALYSVPIFIDPSSQASTLTLPQPESSDPNAAAMHVFAITSIPTSPAQGIRVVSVRPMQGWEEGQKDTQSIAIRVHNTGSDWIQNAALRMTGSGISATAQVQSFNVAPGHPMVLYMTVKSKAASESPATVSVTITASDSGNYIIGGAANVPISLGLITEYATTKSSLQQHEAPQWLKRAKFGIFIHWGLYSVPAWAPVGKDYAEWYWWQSNQPNDPTHAYHKQTYGENFTYDDFMNQWKPSQFDPNAWLSLIDAAKARYFVFTTKHHDGIALFDTKVTDRSTAKLLQPNRNFVQELIQTAKNSYPHLRRGLYFSLPEWYNPKYNDISLGWHGPPVNPYIPNSPPLPYTGSLPITDFVNDLQVPQFLELVHTYEPDILWCDIGGINNSTEWQAEYFNQARANGREVAINDRCGNGVSDFQTAEYATVTDLPGRFWEATRGIDPYSFGYNSQTTDDQYANTTLLVQTLVNSVTQGGNFLLDIGPKSSGAIPDIMAERLQEIGIWLYNTGPSVFDADPYWLSSGSEDMRFTVAQDGSAFYIFCMQKPGTTLTIDTPLPINSNAIITLLGDDQSLSWSIQRRNLTISIPENVIGRGQYVWVFQAKNSI